MKFYALPLALLLPGAIATLTADSCEEPPPPEPTVILSEYLEGASWDKAVELYNATDSEVDLGDYQLWFAFNGNPWPGTEVDLSGTLAPGATFVVAHPRASQVVLDRADMVSDDASFNGNDAIGLARGGELIDAIGDGGNDPITGWMVEDVPNATVDHRLIRAADVRSGAIVWSDARDAWTVHPPSPATTLGIHPHGAEDAECQASPECVPGLSCVGKPNPYYGMAGPGCCTDTAQLPGEGANCGGDSDCGDGLICIATTCSPTWMADSFTTSPNLPLNDNGVTTDQILVSCLASVPVDQILDLRIVHSNPEQLTITVTDPGGTSDAVVYNGEPVEGDVLELTGVRFNATGDDAVNGPWTLTVTDHANQDTGTLVNWTLHLTSRYD